MLDKGQENRGRLLLTNVALITSAVDLAKQITNAKNNQNIINDHNETVSKANAENKNIEVSGNVKASDMPGAKEAQEGLARHTVESGFNYSNKLDRLRLKRFKIPRSMDINTFINVIEWK